MMTNTKREVRHSTEFKRDYKRAKKQGKNIALLFEIIEMLANDKLLPPKYYDHSLSGKWKGYRECHVTPDWLLVYRKTDNNQLLLLLARVASHSDLDF
jgi:mRNA interferase YafQ